MWPRCTGIIAFIFYLEMVFVFALPKSPSSKDADQSGTLLSLLPRTTIAQIDYRDQTSSIDLIKRDWRSPEYRNMFTMVQHYAEGWTAHFNLLDIIRTNVDVAAHELEQFYRAVLSMVDVNKTTRPAQLIWQASFNGVTMVFRSHRPIPWEWIQFYLIDVINTTRRISRDALMGSYKILFCNAVGAVFIVAQLKLPWAGAAPGA